MWVRLLPFWTNENPRWNTFFMLADQLSISLLQTLLGSRSRWLHWVLCAESRSSKTECIYGAWAGMIRTAGGEEIHYGCCHCKGRLAPTQILQITGRAYICCPRKFWKTKEVQENWKIIANWWTWRTPNHRVFLLMEKGYMFPHCSPFSLIKTWSDPPMGL